MSESVLVPVEEDEDLGLHVLKLRLQGQTAIQIGRELMIPAHQVHKALDAVLPKIDASYRRRAIAESLVVIDSIIGEHMKTIRDPESASVVIRATCERRALLGEVRSRSSPQIRPPYPAFRPRSLRHHTIAVEAAADRSSRGAA